jgi:hypothetical protein
MPELLAGALAVTRTPVDPLGGVASRTGGEAEVAQVASPR